MTTEFNDNMDIESMSDDEILAMDFSGMDVVQEDEPEQQQEQSQEEASEESFEEEDSGSEEEHQEFEQESEEGEESSEEDAETDNEPQEGSEEEQGDTSDYEALYKELLAPFKANGREMQIDNVEDARRLMSMGANYNKKMQAINPHLKTIKTLEKHGLLDENKLNFLIELDKKEPQAIQKLLADSKIDPMDIELDENAGNYQAKDHQVSEQDVALGQVIEDLRDHPDFDKTMHEVTQVWDVKSRNMIVKNPKALRVLQEHRENGIYDKVRTEVENRIMFGLLPAELSDFEAYYQVGNDMQAKGLFNDDTAPSKSANVTPSKGQEAKQNTGVRKRKQAAAATRGRKSTKPSLADYDPLNMSDEEVMKVTEQFGIR